MSEADNEGTLGEFDLQPDPRLLQMLGEIDLEPWRCIAELVDNSVDGFLQALRQGTPVENAAVGISLPGTSSETARIQVFDNGPGMDGETLERAVRAGWSGNNPIDSLGLFGMGFNIATARLGATTTVWSTRAGDDVVHGVRIDFADLRARRSFRTPHLVQSKSNPEAHYTRIEVSNLKLDQRDFVVNSANQRALRNMLSKSYASMLRANGDPIHFALRVNDVPVDSRRHCTWDEERVVEVPGIGQVPAYKPFDHRLLVDGVVCSHCLASMLATDVEEGICPSCGRNDTLEHRERWIRGWIGLQRYLHGSDFGIDFIRNGRKIEIANKDLFQWTHDGVSEVEYPIDDQRNRGRFVGEIHIDHCPVDYSKQRFVREHRSWREMVEYVRGEAPLRPQIAERFDFPPNHSILANHFKAFRRTSPSSSQAGGWARILVVPDNGVATEMMRKFHKGEPDYQSDARWWDLVQEEDEKRLYGDDKPTGGGTKGSGAKAEVDPVTELFGEGEAAAEQAAPVAAEPPRRERVASLSRAYDYPKPVNASFDVEAFRVDDHDPDLPDGSPWRLARLDPKSRGWTFLFRPLHPIFSSITMSPDDALLTEIAALVSETTRDTLRATSMADALARLREAYAERQSLRPADIAQSAARTIDDIAAFLVSGLSPEERKELFDGLPEEERGRIASGIVFRGGAPAALENGGFLRLFPEQILPLVDRHPSLFFDGALWNTEYEALDLKDPQATLQAQRAVRDRLRSVLSDAIWATTIDRADPPPSRDEMIRGVAAVRLLVPDRAPD